LRYSARPARQAHLKHTEYYEQYRLVAGVRPSDDEPGRVFDDPPPPANPMLVSRRRDLHVARKYRMLPRAGVVYYLRVLLQNRAASVYDELRTERGEVHEAFQAAAEALGLVMADNEYVLAMQELVDNHAPLQRLRELLVIVALEGGNQARRILEDPDLQYHMALDLPGGYAPRRPRQPLAAATSNHLLRAIEQLLSHETMRDVGTAHPSAVGAR
jgi:hypothetical protein